MKTKNYTLVIALVACLFLMSLIVKTNGDVQVGSQSTAIYNDAIGRFSQAQGFNFNSSNPNKGLVVEYGASESGGLYVDGDYAIIWSPGDQSRLLRIYDEDNMSPGSTTYEKAYIDGTGGYFKVSDKKFKKDIATIDNALAKLTRINGVNYRYIKDKSTDSEKLTAGFIAQDIETVIPEAVDTDEHGNKFLDYDAIIPYLVEALKSQKKTIDSLKVEVGKIKK